LVTEITRTLTVEEYIQLEKELERPAEFEGGKLIEMGGASKEHNKIVRNLIALLWNIFKETGEVEIYGSDLRVHIPGTRRYYYPDLVITKGREQFAEDLPDTLLNPVLLIEVLSESTEARDRGIKFETYRQLDSLQEYVLLAQDQPKAELFRRTGEGDWLVGPVVQEFDQAVALRSLSAHLPMAEIYRGLTFTPSSKA